MTTAVAPADSPEQQTSNKLNTGKTIAFFLAFVALAAVILTPIAGLAMPAKIALGMLAFAVIMWVTEAVSYPVSSVLIISLISLLVGLSPDPETVSYTHLTLPTTPYV